MCKNLVEKGNLSAPLVVYNRSVSKATEFVNQQPIGTYAVASSVEAAVASADIIFACLADDAAISDTLTTALKSDVAGKLFVDCSTVHPDTTTRLAGAAHARGADFVACPVFGAPPMAAAGQLVCVLAGPDAAVARVRPYCVGVLGRAVLDYGGQPVGTALRMKLIGNTFILGMVETLAEGHTLAEKCGLGTDNLHEFVETMFPGPYVAYSGRMCSGDYFARDEVGLETTSGVQRRCG